MNGLEVAIFDIDSKFSTTTTTNIEEEDSETDSESSDSDETCPEKLVNDSRNHLKLPTNNHLDESSDFIQFQGTHDDVVDGANFSTMDSTHDKRLLPTEKQPNNNIIKNSLEFNESQPHLKLKWATLYIQMSYRPLTLRTWLDERNKHRDFKQFYLEFIQKSIQQWDRPIVDDESDDDEINRNGTTGAVAKLTNQTRRRQSMSSTLLEKNLTKDWDSLDVTLNIFIQVLNGLRYIHLQNIVSTMHCM